MTKEIHTSIVINAIPEKIWAILSDFEQYPSWNPFITAIQGKMGVGHRLVVAIVPPGGKKMIFKPKIQILEKHRKLQWLGHFLFKGLFDGSHSFQLIDQGNGTTLFQQNETFRGLLVRFFPLDATKKGFEAMNRALKEVVEQENSL
ncbi:SRPBCC family protein [Spongiimicrobium salis]|uniref:SRPBCC family protein n=1 Tax=Spongiimicrobium salis TaxID=1667022 RepID=UPI00374DC2FF